jgi:hypothetical protein
MTHKEQPLMITSRKPNTPLAFALVLSLIAGTAVFTVAGTTPTAAAYRHPGAKSVSRWFPRGLARRKPARAGTRIWELNAWRTTRIAVQNRRRRVVLSVDTNGLFEEKWPYTRILDTVLGRTCGIRERGLGKRLLDRMYKSKSLIKGRNLGGNGGVTFRKRVRLTRNGCRITMIGNGARWHTIVTTIRAAK